MLVRAGALCILAVYLASCSRELDIEHVSVERGAGGNVNISVTLPTEDLRTIKRRQIYAQFVLVECSSKRSRYPFNAFVAGERSPDYRLHRTRYTKISGTVPLSIFMEYSDPCSIMEGGSYFSFSLNSNKVSLFNARTARLSKE